MIRYIGFIILGILVIVFMLVALVVWIKTIMYSIRERDYQSVMFGIALSLIFISFVMILFGE